MTENVYWLLTVDVNPGKMDDATSLMQEMVSATQDNEPGTLNYEWNFSADKSSIHLFERYANSEAIMIHLGNFGSKYAERFMQCFSPTGLSVYGKPSADVQDALAAFGPVYYSQAAGFAR